MNLFQKFMAAVFGWQYVVCMMGSTADVRRVRRVGGYWVDSFTSSILQPRGDYISSYHRWEPLTPKIKCHYEQEVKS